MRKKILSLGAILLFTSFVYAQEQITITTYYPSPYGSYSSLQTDKLGVGDNNSDGSLTSADVPTTTGDVWIKGKVGIGTGTAGPNAPLSVYRAGEGVSNISIWGDAGTNIYGGGIYFPTNGASGAPDVSSIRQKEFSENEYGLEFATYQSGLSPRVVILGSGNVGIGTLSPAAKLDVQRTTTYSFPTPGQATGTLHLSASDPNAVTNAITFAGPDGYIVLAEAGIYSSVAFGSGSTLHFGTTDDFNAGSKVRMTINQSGNVGIGTAAVDQRLDVYKSGAGASAIKIKADQNNYPNGGINDLGSLMFGVDGGGSGAAVVGKIRAFQSSGKYGLMFSQYGTGLTDSMVLDGNGNVGIGTTGPGFKLDILGADSNGTIAKFARGGLEKPLYVSSVWNTDSYISSEGNIRLRTNVPANNPLGAGAVEAVMINTTGNVGIGTTSPGGYKLNVAGTIYTSGGCTSCSDARWKTNITPISAPLGKIMALTGVQFNWKTKEYPSMFFQEGLDYGLVAQDVEKTLSEIVYEDNGYKYIRYDRLSAILIEAAKEQQKEINDLREELAQQKVEIASLKEKL